jgi:hypothetical protein
MARSRPIVMEGYSIFWYLLVRIRVAETISQSAYSPGGSRRRDAHFLFVWSGIGHGQWVVGMVILKYFAPDALE